MGEGEIGKIERGLFKKKHQVASNRQKVCGIVLEERARYGKVKTRNAS